MERSQDTLYENKWNHLLTWHRQKADFRPHYHTYLELLMVEHGSCIVSVDFRDYRMKSGDAVLVFPNRIHAYRNSSDPIENFTFMLPPELFPLYSGVFCSKVPENPMLHGLLSEQKLRSLVLAAREANESDSVYAPAIAAGYISLLLGELLPRFELIDPPSDVPNEARLIAYCSEHFREPLSLSSLEEALNISRFHISHLFSERLNISFPRLLCKLRVENAARLLRSGASVTEAAFASGFGSLRSFNRAFSEERGCTPSEFKKATQKQE
ncbi:MAG: helix-turn-helix domain-containing protein [Eubacteriales bacterium]